MKVKELIRLLQEIDGEKEIRVVDSDYMSREITNVTEDFTGCVVDVE